MIVSTVNPNLSKEDCYYSVFLTHPKKGYYYNEPYPMQRRVVTTVNPNLTKEDSMLQCILTHPEEDCYYSVF